MPLCFSGVGLTLKNVKVLPIDERNLKKNGNLKKKSLTEIVTILYNM